MGNTAGRKITTVGHSLVSSPLSVGWGARLDGHGPVVIDAAKAVEAFCFRLVRDGVLELPVGWFVDGRAPVSLNDASGRTRSEILPGNDGGLPSFVFDPRFTVRELTVTERVGTSSPGRSRVAICDNSVPVLLTTDFPDWDAAARDAAVEAATAWLDRVRPGHQDAASHWEGEPLPISGTSFASLPLEQNRTWLSYPGDGAFLALCDACGCDRVTIRGAELVGRLYPQGWGMGGGGRMLDRHGRERIAIEVSPAGVVTMRFMPRYRVATLGHGDAEGMAIGLCRGRVRVALTDAGSPIHCSPEFSEGATQAIQAATKALGERLSTAFPDHADVLAYWSDDVGLAGMG